LVPICTKSSVDWGFAPDPSGGAYSAPPSPIGVFRGPTSKGRARGRTGQGREEEGRRERRREGKGEGRQGVRPLPSAPMMVWLSLGSRTAKEQNRTQCMQRWDIIIGRYVRTYTAPADMAMSPFPTALMNCELQTV